MLRSLVLVVLLIPFLFTTYLLNRLPHVAYTRSYLVWQLTQTMPDSPTLHGGYPGVHFRAIETILVSGKLSAEVAGNPETCLAGKSYFYSRRNIFQDDTILMILDYLFSPAIEQTSPLWKLTARAVMPSSQNIMLGEWKMSPELVGLLEPSFEYKQQELPVCHVANANISPCLRIDTCLQPGIYTLLTGYDKTRLDQPLLIPFSRPVLTTAMMFNGHFTPSEYADHYRQSRLSEIHFFIRLFALQIVLGIVIILIAARQILTLLLHPFRLPNMLADNKLMLLSAVVLVLLAGLPMGSYLIVSATSLAQAGYSLIFCVSAAVAVLFIGLLYALQKNNR